MVLLRGHSGPENGRKTEFPRSIVIRATLVGSRRSTWRSITAFTKDQTAIYHIGAGSAEMRGLLTLDRKIQITAAISKLFEA